MGRDVTAIAPQLVAPSSWLAANLQPCGINREVCVTNVSPNVYVPHWITEAGKIAIL